MARFECAVCGDVCEVDDSLAGKAVRCTRCKEPGRVSRAKAQPSTPVSPPPPAAPPPGSGASVQARPPANLWDPWFFRFIDIFADWGVVVGLLGCVVGCIISIVAIADMKEDKRVLAAFSAILLYGLVFAGIVFWISLAKVLVDAARSLRRLVDQGERSQHRP